MFLDFIFKLISFLFGLVFKYGLSAFFAYAVLVFTTRAANLPDLFWLRGKKRRQPRRESRASDDAEPEPGDDGEPTRGGGTSEAETVREPAPDIAAHRLREPTPRKYALPGALAVMTFLTHFAPAHPVFSFALFVPMMVAELAFMNNVRRHAKQFQAEVLPALAACFMLWFALMAYAASVKYHLAVALRTTLAVIVGIILESAPSFLTLALMAMLVVGFLRRRRSSLKREQSRLTEDGFEDAVARLNKKVITTNVLLVVSAIVFGWLIITCFVNLIRTIFGF